ncbi:hypothetical protein KHP62_19400 [Rhodobacteraceae bacterium NNCM2]|nr:hypothetical protein [Coraliihabitans acroporae]
MNNPRSAAFAVFVTAAPLALAGCVGPTPYSPAVERNGYADHPLEADRYVVSFAGNSQTSRETVETYLLYRSAEVTLAAGKDWFRVANQDTEAQTRYRSFDTGFGAAGFGPYFYRSGFNYGYFGGVGTATSVPITRYEAYANILVFDGEKPEGDPGAYDARSVIETLGPRVVRPEDG